MSNNPVSFVDPDGGYDVQVYVDGMPVYGMGLDDIAAKFSRSGTMFDMEMIAFDANGRALYSEEYKDIHLDENGILKGQAVQAKFQSTVLTKYWKDANGKTYGTFAGLFRDPWSGETFLSNSTVVAVYKPLGTIGMRMGIVSEIAGLRDWRGAAHTGLDAIGMVQGWGEIADGLNAIGYYMEGDNVNAALSLAAMAGPAGVGVTLGKWAKRGNNAVKSGNKLATGANEAVFWSGIGKNGDAIAARWAAQNGGVTLESTLSARGVVLPAWNVNDPSSIAAWTEASVDFANGASGHVRVLQGETLRVDAIWKAEYFSLRANPAVQSIRSIDPESGLETLLWSR
jgi:hypothetical protein